MKFEQYKKYFVNTQAKLTQVHEVHREGCKFMPSDKKLEYLGEFTNNSAAVTVAEKKYILAEGCPICSGKKMKTKLYNLNILQVKTHAIEFDYE